MSLHAPNPVTRAVEVPQPRLTLVEPRAVDPSVAAPAPSDAATLAGTEAGPAEQPAPPSGWYPDPNGGGLLRWWSGDVWTSVVRPPVSAVLSAPAAAVAVPVTADTISSGTVAEPAEPGGEYDWGRESAGRASRERTRTLPPSASVSHRNAWQNNAMPTRSHTAAVWILAFLPYVQLVAAVTAFVLLGLDDQTMLLIAVGFVLVTFVLAIRDSSVLRREGYRRAPQSAWALLGPLPYLIARSVTIKRQNGSATSALWVWIINALLAVGLVAGLALTVGKPYLQYFGVEF